MFVVFEGIDNSGKSTQIKMLNDFFINNGRICTLTKEPNDNTVLGKNIREILTRGNPDDLDPETELLLMNASRRNHINKIIKPILENGGLILCDRFLDSTLAYQGLYIDKNTILNFHKNLCFNIFPDVVFLFDIDPIISFSRNIDNFECRFEKKGILFMEKVRERFLLRSKENTNSKYFIIDGNQNIEDIHKDIIDKITTVVEE